MLAGPRLRQVAVVAADYEGTVLEFRDAFGWAEPFRDPGVARFGLVNAVFAAGDTFVEVVTPAQPDTAAGRYRDGRGGDSGYMAIFQLPELEQARSRVAAAGIRVIWSADLADIAGTHLHPKDVPGAIVSLDWADPPQSWRWAGPAWTGRAPAVPPHGHLSGITVEVSDPAAAAVRWAQALGVTASADGARADSGPGAASISLPHARQHLRFLPLRTGRAEGITEVMLTTERELPPVQIAGVRFVSTAVSAVSAQRQHPGGKPA
ncbi:MAG TPA: hypothetical protein VFQ44_20895 [Streptosporangiaceae bacterium]|nr:hypothetical protein [Streptosporangiaceae bacterium]